MKALNEIIKRYDSSSVEEYIASKTESSYAERLEWRKTIAKVFGLKEILFIAEEDSKILGIAQLFLNKSLIGGNHAVSCPLSSSGGGILFDSDSHLHLILDKIERYTKDSNLDYSLLRLQYPIDAKNWECVPDKYVTFIMDLDGDAEYVWSKVFRAKTRNQVRKGQSYNFEICHGHEYLNTFCKILHNGIKELGSPTPGIKMFKEAINNFGNDIEFLILLDKGGPISGTVLFYHNDVVANPWAVTLKKYRSTCANTLLYWEIVKHACKRGIKKFDLGRSLKDSGNYHFKRRLGAKEKPIYYYYFLNKRKCIPVIDSTKGIQKYFTIIWKRLPDILTKSLGHRVTKELI